MSLSWSLRNLSQPSLLQLSLELDMMLQWPVTQLLLLLLLLLLFLQLQLCLQQCPDDELPPLACLWQSSYVFGIVF